MAWRIRGLRGVVVSVAAAGLLVASGCGHSNRGGPEIPLSQQDDESIKLAKESDIGKKMKNGETREFQTVFNTVIITKDPSGNLSYSIKK